MDSLPKSSIYQDTDPLHGPAEIPSSPPSLSASVPTIPSSPPSLRPKKRPPVTPRSFKRFFTPRSSLNSASAGGRVRTNRHALGDITAPVLNRLGPALSRIPDSSEDQPLKSYSHDIYRTPSKKRKLSFSLSSSPLQSSPLRRVRISPPAHHKTLAQPIELKPVTGDDICQLDGPKKIPERTPCMPLRRSKALSTSGQLFLRSLSDSRSKRVTLRASYGTGWQDQVSNFYSRPEDSHKCVYSPNDERGERFTLPFCTASCHTNSLVAIGDEEGSIRLLDSARDVELGFSQAYLSFQPHTNSIMDMEFSSNDKLLATASGDQTCRIIDMPTQTPIYCLSKHSSSVKRVQFQPASNDNVVATCSRDGNVNIWDLRYKAFAKPALQLHCSLNSDTDDATRLSTLRMKYPQPSNSILAAHSEKRSEPQLQRNDMTVTSIAFLHPGRENLFVTSCQSNACVRLWDLRTTYSLRRKAPTPLSITRQPESHEKYRQFGLTSLAFGGDGSRLYTLCRDGTVYAYSTNHLILGTCPEMTPSSTGFRRFPAEEAKPGLGPLYGFRHPRLRVSSFFVKLSIRPAKDDKSEMIAVGSSDNCAVVFPADERYLASSPDSNNATNSSSAPTTPPPASRRVGLRRTNSGTAQSGGRLEDTIPIYQQGAALTNGHAKEVSGVSWTHDGELVTVSDDLHARCWREGPKARDLRRGGESEGRRWGCGWADVPDSYDDEDE
ncbi:hypothetical protein AJ80_06373 [Polytolypa hystricis UAMH7299]|uniref:Uncharacterized protein n=1 Tax=Polytolypa hystricis (strain UAMH7299) TaxID=1447883 RepID=A0A2B7XNB2_POLH7|nr:hypothetical protein AJ80_06373 [Polytolypa hystricis UAMH7299]